METKLKNSTPETEIKITGTLELDEATNILYADFNFPVTSANFIVEQNHRPELFKENGYFGLAFRYFDRIDGNTDNSETVEMRVKMSFYNIYKWSVGKGVRMMAINENEDSIFRNLRPYFEKRVADFEDRDILQIELEAFNNAWNGNNPTPIQVRTYSPINPIFEDIKSPKLTKKDFILHITRK